MRDIPAEVIALLDAGRFGVRTLIRVDMPDGTIGFSDDVQAFEIDDVVYQPRPNGIEVRLPRSTMDGTIEGIEIVVSGLDGAIAAQVENEPYHRRPIYVDLLIFDPAAPQTNYRSSWFAGFIDQIPRQERPSGEARLIVKCESLNRELDRAGTRTRSDADQRKFRDADDDFFAFVAEAKNTPIVWGRQAAPVAPKPRGIARLLDKIF